MVFAKTRDAVFCMACHNIRIARSRKKQELRARQREQGGDSQSRSHRDRSREGHSSRRDKETGGTPPVPLAPLRTDSSPTPEDSALADSPLASQSDVQSGAKRMSIIQTTAQGIPPPPPSPRKNGHMITNKSLHPSSTTQTFASESHARTSLTPTTSPRNSNFSSKSDSLSPLWQQSSHKERHASGSGSASSPRSTMFPQTPERTRDRKDKRRSFNPLDAIIDGMERPYTPRTKSVTANGTSSGLVSKQNNHYEDTSGDGIPDALKEYFQEVVEIEPAPRRPSPPAPTHSAISNGHLQPRSFFDTPSPSVGGTSTNHSVVPTPEPPAFQSTPKGTPVHPRLDSYDHCRNQPSMSSSRRAFEAYDGVEVEETSQNNVQEITIPQRQDSTAGNNTISPQAWLGSPGRSRPVTANREISNNSLLSQLDKMQRPSTSGAISPNGGGSLSRNPSTQTSPTSAHGHSVESTLKTPTDPYMNKPTTPTTPLTPEGVVRPPPSSIPRNVTSEGEGETTETESDFQSPIIKGRDALVVSPSQLPSRELTEDGSVGPVAAAVAAEFTSENSNPESPLPSQPQSASSETQITPTDEEVTSSTRSSGGKKRRKPVDGAPALPPIRISQFYVESPEGVKNIEVTQGPDDSMSSEGNNSFLDIDKKGSANLDAVVEETDDHYVMISRFSEKTREEIGMRPKRSSGSKMEKGSPRHSGGSHTGRGTPTLLVEDTHRQSEDTSGTSEQSHESGTTMSSQSSAPHESTRSQESRETMKNQLSVDKSIKHAQSKSSLRYGVPPASAHGDEVYDVVLSSLNDLVDNATKHCKQVVKLDLKFVEVIKKTVIGERSKYDEIKSTLDSSKVGLDFSLIQYFLTNLTPARKHAVCSWYERLSSRIRS